MRVAFVTEVWSPTINGVVTRLAGTIDELLRNGHKVLVVAPRVEGVDDTGTDGLQVRTVPTISVPFVYGGQSWGLPLPRVGRYLDDFAPDVVHVANPAFLGIAGVIAARRRKTPLVCSYHTDIAAYASYYHLGWLRPVIWKVLRILHSSAAVNLVTSDVAARQLARAGVPRIRMWRRGVDLERFRPTNGDDAVRKTGHPTALYVGRLAEEKGLGVLAELAAVDDLRLVVVGDGPARTSIASRLGHDRVDFTGPLYGDELAAAYRNADVFVFPSTTETLGLVLLEALASGLPVVAAESPASREVLGGCPAARLFRAERPGELAAAVSDLVGSASQDVLAAQARERVEGFGWSAATAQLEEEYREAACPSDACPSRGRVRDQLWRFLAVGASNVAIDLGIFNLLLALNPTRHPLQLVAYNTVAVLLALLNSYWWNSRWTFKHAVAGRSRWSVARRRVLFVGQGVVNVAVNDLAVAGVSAALAGSQLPSQFTGNMSKVAGMVAASLVSFVLLRHVVFRHHEHGRRSRTPGAGPPIPMDSRRPVDGQRPKDPTASAGNGTVIPGPEQSPLKVFGS